MNLMAKTLTFVRTPDGSNWIMSNFTGEIVKPWQLRKVFGLIRDFYRFA